jgi:hypothetical protein
VAPPQMPPLMAPMQPPTAPPVQPPVVVLPPSSSTDRFRSEIIVLPKPPRALDPNPRTACPHLQSGLRRWSDASTWGGNVVPSPNQPITVPLNTKVLIDSSISQDIFSSIIIPSSSELIFADSNINLNVKNIRVNGKFLIGSP